MITLKLIKTWQNDIQTDRSNQTIIKLTQAFHAALKTISGNSEEPDDEPDHFKVEGWCLKTFLYLESQENLFFIGSAVFNAVIQLCVLHLGPALRRFLGLQSGSKQPPHKCKKFNKIKNVLKGYLTDLLKVFFDFICFLSF